MPTATPPRRRLPLPCLLLLSALLLPLGSTSPAGDRPPRSGHPQKVVFLDLGEAFYRALEASPGNEKVYGTTTAMSDEYLRQIAVSTRFMVETNLQLLRQQERIIQLLETRQAPGDK